MAYLAGNAHWAKTSTMFAPSLGWTAYPGPINWKNEFLVFASKEETAARTLVDSMVWAFRRLGKMNPRSYALHSDWHNFPLLFFFRTLPAGYTQSSLRSDGSYIPWIASHWTVDVGIQTIQNYYDNFPSCGIFQNQTLVAYASVADHGGIGKQTFRKFSKCLKNVSDLVRKHSESSRNV